MGSERGPQVQWQLRTHLLSSFSKSCAFQGPTGLIVYGARQEATGPGSFVLFGVYQAWQGYQGEFRQRLVLRRPGCFVSVHCMASSISSQKSI